MTLRGREEADLLGGGEVNPRETVGEGEGGRKGGREGGREGKRAGGREGWREGGRKGGREGGKKGFGCLACIQPGGAQVALLRRDGSWWKCSAVLTRTGPA